MLVSPKLPWYTHMSDRPSARFSIPDDGLAEHIARRVRVSRWFAEDEDGLHIVDGYAGCAIDLAYAARTDGVGQAGKAVALTLWQALDDLNNVGVLLHRMDWMHQQAVQGKVDSALASMYLALDVELFHVELRSSLDYCSRCVAAAAARSGQVPGDSFRRLRNWVAKERQRAVQVLGQDLVTLIAEASWFPEMRGLRDAMVHKGGRVHVFPHEEAILFQVHDAEWNTLVAAEHIMHNENVVDFRPYSAILFSELLIFVDRLADSLRGRFPVPRPAGGKGVRTYNLGFSVFLSSLAVYADAARGGTSTGAR